VSWGQFVTKVSAFCAGEAMLSYAWRAHVIALRMDRAGLYPAPACALDMTAGYLRRAGDALIRWSER
jgi:hypothetical protein